MGRRRRHTPVTMTTIVLLLNFGNNIQTKYRRENQDSFIRRVFAEWQDLKEYRLDMDQVLRLKDRHIIGLENELRNIKTVNLTI